MTSKNSLVQLFEQQVRLNAERTAICFEGERLTYQTLNEKSNQVARYLLDKGVKSGDIVGLLFDRSTDFIVAMWGVLKARATYLPLEPDLPSKRITFMLDKSNAAHIITQKEYAGQYAEAFKVHTIDTPAVADQSSQDLNIPTKATDFAYCIFTSGSTGYPKGVLMKNSSVINLVMGLKEVIYDTFQQDHLNVALIASFSFDASVQQIFSALLLGHCLYIADDESRKEGKALRQFFNNNQIDISDGTPTHLRLLVSACTPTAQLNTLSSWLLAGEVLSKNTVRDFYKKLGTTTQLYNFYGPTETCVDSTYFKVDATNLDTYESIPIGKPLPNERIYITDTDGKILSAGEVGELCIAGEGLAEAYINDYALTNEKFSRDWIEHESKVYRTGDMARMLPDGNLLYQGRIDNQIKLRGLRIELSEIEFQICTHPIINHAVVVVKEIFQEEQLVLYYEAKTAIESTDLRTYLIERLPNYMVPSHFVYMEQLPLNVSGKVDRYALPDVEVLAETNSGGLNDIESKLVEIWEEVLEVPPNWVGLETNFFQLGGNSLKSVLIANRIKQEFGVEVSLAQFFEFQTISNFSSYIAGATTSQPTTILAAEDTTLNPLTLTQKCFYFINSQQNKQAVTYNIPQVFKLSGEITLEQLNLAFQKLIQRYEILRTSFYENEEGIQCRVDEQCDFSVRPLVYTDDLASSVLNFMGPFDLSQSPLLRAGLLSKNTTEHYFILDIHHIISDEVSNRILIQELFRYYRGEDLPQPKLQYRDYAVWQQGEHYQNLVEKHKNYWLDVYAEEVPVLDLPTDHSRPFELSDQAHVHTIKLEKALSDQIRTVLAKEGTTIFNFLFAVYYIFLSKISNQEDIVVGTPVSGRHHVDLESIIGLFVNTLALRNQPKSELNVRDFIAALQENTLQALDHQLYPYIDLVDELRITRNINRNPLFDVYFNYNQKMDEQLQTDHSVSLEVCEMPYNVTKFDLTLDIVEAQDSIDLSLIGRKDLFEPATIKRFSNYLKHIIEQVLVDINQPIKNIETLPEEEKQQLLAFNQHTDFTEQSIVNLFTQQVQQTPHQQAIVFQDQVLSYQELEEQSNQLARFLNAKGIGKETLVGLVMDRSIAMITSWLAILKTGAAFVPIDPEYPKQRIEFLIQDADIKWVVSTSNYATNLTEKGHQIIALDNIWEEVLRQNAAPLPDPVQPDSLMYVIYTSGSTGRPKGVMVEHRSVANMSAEQIKRFNVTAEDKVLQFAALTFDASVSEILMTLLCGATLVLVDKDLVKEPQGLIQYMKDQQVSVVTLPPAYLKVMDNDQLTFLRCLITAGEAAIAEDAQYLSQHLEYYNAYGPTECAVCISTYRVDPQQSYGKQIPIGQPLSNLNVYILDQNNQLCPIGVCGELCVSGIGVAKGYLNRPELTNEKFSPCPINPEERMYRTGDYARWNINGQLEFFGRKDDQVKINGFRIEPGEIEAILNESSLVKQASVQVIGESGGNKRLVAYLVPEGDEDSGAIHNYLSNKLPAYMTPALVRVQEIPLTSHGKVDREKLITQKAEKPALVLPSNPTEEKLLQIWSAELGIQEEFLGTTDNFFKLGGNSLIAMQIISKINAVFQSEIAINDIFKYQTIRQIAKQIEINQWLDNVPAGYQKENRKEAFI